MSRLLPGFLVLVILSTACRHEAPRPPNVLIVVIDTLRADRLGAYGHQGGLTPFLDLLARRGTLFEHAYAASSWTVPSVASVLTSRHLTQHQVSTFFSRLAEEEVTFPERLRDAGWITAGFSANPNVRVESGFGQGLDELWNEPTPHVDVRGDALRAQALARLDRTWNRHAGSPAVLYLQYMEPHEPYDPPEPFRSRFVVDDDGKPFDMEAAIRASVASVLPGAGRDATGKPPDAADAVRAILARGRPVTDEELAPIKLLSERRTRRLYEGDVASADDQMRRLFDELERRGFLDNAVVVLTSDHGEEFGEHGGTSHGRTLYEESVRVPLILMGAGVPAGRRVAENVSLLDLGPTLLDLLGLPAEVRFEGRSLVPLMRAGAGSERAAAPDVLLQLEPMLPVTADGRVHARALVRRDRKLLVRPDDAFEVYDLGADPGETRSTPAALGVHGPTMRESLSLAEAELGERAGSAAPPVPLDAAHERRLRALGYLP